MISVKFDVSYGRKQIDALERRLQDCNALIVTQPNLWEFLGGNFKKKHEVFFVETMEECVLEENLKNLDLFDVTIGLGGGMAIDCAKYFAWKKGCDTYLVPTIVSVDACFSYPIAIRVNNNVNYVGVKIPETIFVDFDIIQSAPKKYNRYGMGDLLSCYTACFDWGVMKSANEGVFEPEYYERSQMILNDLFSNSHEIRDVTEKGIQMIMNGYKWVGETSAECGYCFFEEGSEHFFAYAIESLTGLHLAHGQLVCLGVYVMSKFQSEGRQWKVKELLADLDIDIRPEAIGISYEILEQALLSLNDYVEKQNLSYSVLNEKKISPVFVSNVINELKSM